MRNDPIHLIDVYIRFFEHAVNGTWHSLCCKTENCVSVHFQKVHLLTSLLVQRVTWGKCLREQRITFIALCTHERSTNALLRIAPLIHRRTCAVSE